MAKTHFKFQALFQTHVIGEDGEPTYASRGENDTIKYSAYITALPLATKLYADPLEAMRKLHYKMATDETLNALAIDGGDTVEIDWSSERTFG